MIIGISGKAGSGKDTLADCILDLDIRFTKKSFAYKLKRICHILTGGELANQFLQTGKQRYLIEWGMTIGQMQQRIGTDAIRNVIHQDAWVMALFADYRSTDKWVIPDVRFENEAQAILDHGGFLVRIDGTRLVDTGRDTEHISETELDEWDHWDYRFDNSTLTLGGLRYHARQILNKVYKDNGLYEYA